MVRHTTVDIRRNNRLTVLRSIYAAGRISRQQIAAEAGLSQATVANVVNDLINSGIVIEASREDSRGGRPRAMLAVNAEAGRIVGIEAAETYIHFELFDLAFNVKHSVQHWLHPEENQPREIVSHLVRGLDQLLAESGTPHSDVIGVGVSLPGQVEPRGGVSVFAPNWGWHDVPLLNMLRERISLPLYVDNPLKASAISQLWFGAGRETANLITVTVGTGVGTGVILNGALYRGVTNSAGEWGHSTIVLGGRPCRCGSRGCLESYVGAPGIMQHLREIDPESELLYPDDQTATIDALAEAAGAGDLVAKRVIAELARYLGAGVANLVNIFNPEIIIIDGWVSQRLGPYMLDEVREVAARYALRRSMNAVRLEMSDFSHSLVSVGAATWVIDGYLAGIGTKIFRTTPGGHRERQRQPLTAG